MPTIVVLAWLVSTLGAQFDELVTTDDGARLFFTSQLRVRDSAAAQPELRLYRHAGAIELIAERGELARRDSFGTGDGVRGVTASGDGQLVGYSLVNVCPSAEPCNRTILQAQIRGPEKTTVLGEGTVLVSRNGRWAVLAPPPFGPGPPGATVLIELATGQRTEIPPLAVATIAPASDGTALVQQNRSVGLWRNGQFTAVEITGAFFPRALSADGRVLAYQRVRSPSPQNPVVEVVARDLESGRETVVSAAGLPVVMGMSDDGRWLLYRITTTSPEGTARIADTQSGESAALLEQELTTAGTVSGSGNSAFLVTTSGRIVRIDLMNGQPVGEETIVPATPYLSSFGFTPGSLAHLSGTLPRDAEALRGRILVDGIAMPIVEVTDTDIAAQVPWETGLRANLVLESAVGIAVPAERSHFRAADAAAI